MKVLAKKLPKNLAKQQTGAVALEYILLCCFGLLVISAFAAEVGPYLFGFGDTQGLIGQIAAFLKHHLSFIETWNAGRLIIPGDMPIGPGLTPITGFPAPLI